MDTPIGDVVFIIGALAVSWQVVRGLFFPEAREDVNLALANPAFGPVYLDAHGGATDAHQDDNVCCGQCGGNL